MKKWIKAVALTLAAASVLSLGACKKPAEDPDAALKEDVLLNNFEFLRLFYLQLYRRFV